MTVRELIAELQKCPQDYEVVTFDNDGCVNRFYCSNSIEVDDDDEEVWL